MAVYNVIVKRIRGVVNSTTMAAIQAYIESIDATAQPIIYMDIVGDNNYITCFITHTHNV